MEARLSCDIFTVNHELTNKIQKPNKQLSPVIMHDGICIMYNKNFHIQACLFTCKSYFAVAHEYMEIYGICRRGRQFYQTVVLRK